jgi:hypothetical protein
MNRFSRTRGIGPCLRLGLGFAALFIGVSCGNGDLLGPAGDPVPVTSENLKGQWRQVATIYYQAAAPHATDTVAPASSDQLVYDFEVAGPGIVRRVAPSPASASYVLDSYGPSIAWSFDTNEAYLISLTASRLSLGGPIGITNVHRFSPSGPLEVAGASIVFQRE